jgi:hypothetical protein
MGFILVASLAACGSAQVGSVHGDKTASGGQSTSTTTSGMAGSDSTGAGGSTGSGGSNGTGGAVIIRNCDSLPAAGQWQNITPPPFKDPSNMETLAVIVSPQDQTVYAAAGNKTNMGNGSTGVYKSIDCGATFTFVSTGAGKDKIMSGDPWAMMIDPSNTNVLYINNGYGTDPTIYKSTDAGVDWTALSPHPVWKTASHVQAIAMERGNPQHLAVTFHATCDAPYNGLCLSRSNDGGANWQVFNGPTQLNAWQEAATLTILGPMSYLYAAITGGWYTADEGKTWAKVADDTFYGSYAGSTDIAPDGTMYLGGATSIYTSNSKPLGSMWTKIAGSPRSTVVIDDGTNLFCSLSWAQDNPVFTAKVAAPATWTQMMQSGRGANQLAYDSAHHLVYAANWGNGLWRLVTQ